MANSLASYFGSSKDRNVSFDGSDENESAEPTSELAKLFGKGEPEKEKKNKQFSRLLKELRKLGKLPTESIQKSEDYIKQSAPDYARFLSGQVASGQRSPLEASDLFSDFTLAYNVPGGFETAAQLGGLTAGLAPKSAVTKYRPYQQFAAGALGIGLSEADARETEMAARAIGATSPEAFKQLLGAKMMSSPEYIRKNPLAFAANLPEGGYFGVPYQRNGTFTGTYRFNPPSKVDYS